MDSYPSPRTPGSTPMHEWEYARMASATPTPSPRPTWLDATPRRSSTRSAHQRATSYSYGGSTPRAPPVDSPRYNSSGQYATVDVSPKAFSSSQSRRPSFGPFQAPAWRERRYSSHQHQHQHQHHTTTSSHHQHHPSLHHTFAPRASTPYGESDEDEIFEASGRTYVLLAEPRSGSGSGHFKSRGGHSHLPHDYHDEARYTYTNRDDCRQGATTYFDYPEPSYSREHSPFESHHSAPSGRPPTSHSHSYSHSRRSSAHHVPQRPPIVRPATAHAHAHAHAHGAHFRAGAANKPPQPPKATDADARRHKIPAGYSLKNWDPEEEPILLLGSVFDANSLGKWIYDWTVYRAGANTPIAEMAGDLWLLLIKLSGKTKRAEDTIGRVRSAENRETIHDFLCGGERLTEKLRSLLKACEAPMLRAATKKKQAGLGKHSGVEFVDTLFGRDRELAKTEKFMQSVRLFLLRFDANCEEILHNPGL